MDGTCSAYRGDGKCIQILVIKSEGKKPLRRPRNRCEDNIQMYFGEEGEKVSIGFTWRRTGNGEGLLQTQ